MKGKRHFFHIFRDVFYTALSVFCMSFAGTLAILNATKWDNEGNNVGFFVFLVLFLLPLFVFCFFPAFNGWASWSVDGDRLVVRKLFRRTRSVPLGEVCSIRRSHLEVLAYPHTDTIDAYEISGGGTTLHIPKTKKSEALVAEILERNNIQEPE